MIVRDSFGIIVQHPTMDGGDSASRTGIMALCGSDQDKKLLPKFLTYPDDQLVRHPYQENWKKPKLTSRDQLVMFSAGQFPFVREPRAWKINSDVLLPDVKLYLYKCYGLQAPLWLKLLGYPNLVLSILWNCFIKPSAEQNQIVCICLVMGKPWIKLLNKLHPALALNINDYWSGWRNQQEIGFALVNKINEALK